MEIGSDSLTLGLVSEIFSTEDELVSCLKVARSQGADLVVLPELPLNGWSPATKKARVEDSEGPGGRRETIQCNAARRAGVAVLGGVIRVMSDGRRVNLALLINAQGTIVGSSAKHVLPDEEGFWECDHYEPIEDPPQVIEFMDAKVGIQICSDANRSTAAQLLAAQGVQVILAPRASSIPYYSSQIFPRLQSASLVVRSQDFLYKMESASWPSRLGRPPRPFSHIFRVD